MNGEHRLAGVYLREAVAAARNEIAALRAAAQDRPQAARLLRAVARAQRVHADKALMLLRGRTGDTDANLAEAAGALEQTAEHYKHMLTQMPEGDAGADAGFIDQFRRTALGHRALLAQLDETAPVPYHVCTVCGFVFREEVRGRCPVCQAVESRFERID